MNFGGDSGAKPKPKGALAALLVDDAEAPPSTPEAQETDHGFRALAKAFGIPLERQAAAQAALQQYVRQCISDGESSEADEYGDL